MSEFHKLTIKKIHKETANAVSIVFDIPNHLTDKFNFSSGQYLTLKTELNGQEIRRAYSICSSPKSNEVKVAVKAVDGGTFSVHATQLLKEGDTIEVFEPEGFFILNPEENKYYLGFAAGSGITPILSMVKTTLEDSNTSTFTLVYGNKNIDETIFKTELDNLHNQYPERFNLHYVFSRERAENSLHGRIDEGITNLFVKNKYKETSFDAAYLCGPEAMIKTVSKTLQECGLEESQISFELFTSSTEEQNTEKIKEGMTQVTVLLDDEELGFEMKQTDDVLSAALRNDVDAPYSCQGGVCSSCLAKVTQGAAIMTKNSILTDGEVEDGFILTCQAHPTTPTITVDFDDV